MNTKQTYFHLDTRPAEQVSARWEKNIASFMGVTDTL